MVRTFKKFDCCIDHLFRPVWKIIVAFITTLADSCSQIMNAANLATKVGQLWKNNSNLFIIVQTMRSNQIMDPLHPLVVLRLQRHRIYGLCTSRISHICESLWLWPGCRSCLVWSFTSKMVHLTWSNIVSAKTCIGSIVPSTPMLFNVCIFMTFYFFI